LAKAGSPTDPIHRQGSPTGTGRPAPRTGAADGWAKRCQKLSQKPCKESAFVHAEDERLRGHQLAGHITVEREDQLLHRQFHLGRTLAEIELVDVHPHHVGRIGALEVVTASGQILHSPEDGAGDVRLVRVWTAEGHGNVPDHTEHVSRSFSLAGRLRQPVGVVGRAHEPIRGGALAGQRLRAAEGAVLLEILDLLVVGGLVGHHGEALVVIDFRLASDELDHSRIAGFVGERHVHQRGVAVGQGERLDLERVVLLRCHGLRDGRVVVEVVLHPLHHTDAGPPGIALAETHLLAREVERVAAQTLFVHAFMGAHVVGREHQASVLRCPGEGVDRHRPGARDPAGIHAKGGAGLLRPILGSADEHLPIRGFPEDSRARICG